MSSAQAHFSLGIIGESNIVVLGKLCKLLFVVAPELLLILFGIHNGLGSFACYYGEFLRWHFPEKAKLTSLVKLYALNVLIAQIKHDESSSRRKPDNYFRFIKIDLSARHE